MLEAMTERQRSNLRRGGGTRESAAVAAKARAEYRAEDERVASVVREDPEASLSELHAQLVLGVRYMTRKWLSSREEPSRQVVAAWTELRRLTSEVAALRRLRTTPDLDADAFWSTLAQRVPTLERLAESAVPVVEPEDG
jgi:hypothetical protein